MSVNRLYQIPVKMITGIFLFLLLGLPVVETWKMIILLGGFVALIHGDIRLEKRRLLWGMGIIIPLLIIKALLPVAGIEEGHNIFLYLKEGETLQRGLPAPIFNEWRKEFDQLYPPVLPPYEPYTWRYALERGGLPDRLYAYSSDSLWHSARYSRKVSTISFRNLAEFRGGFANELKYGGEWYRGTLDRRKMPFFVMYELSRSSIGCMLYWPGLIFWEKEDGSFEKIVHQQSEGKTITPSDVGRRVFLLFFPDKTPQFFVHLKLNRQLAVSRFSDTILTILGFLFLLVFWIHIRWRPYLAASTLVALALVLIYLSISFSGGKPLGALYTPHGGGDDGIQNESWGREITRLASQGEIKEALKGSEDVYYSTPGMRYVRAIEKVFFGDTNLGVTAFLACLPWFIYLLLNRLCGLRWAVGGTILFLLSPLNFSYAQYIFLAMLGYAEPMGSGLFWVGFFLFLKSQPRWGGEKNLWFTFIGGACLAGAVFLRPNLAIAGILLSFFYFYTCWRDKNVKIFFLALAGLSLSLWMPFHNLFYAQEFYLISKSGPTINLTLTPLTYMKAVQEFLTGQWQGTQMTQAINQVKGWLWTPPVTQYPLRIGISFFLFLRLITLFVTVTALILPGRKSAHVFLLAWIALAAHLPMLFVFETKLRYDILGWDLSAIVTLLVIIYYTGRPAERFLNKEGTELSGKT